MNSWVSEKISFLIYTFEIYIFLKRNNKCVSKHTWIQASPSLWEATWLCADCETEKDIQSENVELAEEKLSVECRKRHGWHLSDGDTTQLTPIFCLQFNNTNCPLLVCLSLEKKQTKDLVNKYLKTTTGQYSLRSLVTVSLKSLGKILGISKGRGRSQQHPA